MASVKRRLLVVVTVVAIALSAMWIYRLGLDAESAASPQDASNEADGANWAATWATAAEKPTIGWRDNWSVTGFADQSVRQVIRPATDGRHVRLTLTNVYGTRALRVAAVSIGSSAGGARVEPGSLKTVTFAGSASVSIPEGEQATSDAVSIRVTALEPVTVTLYFAEPTGPASFHDQSFVMSYLADGNHVHETDAAPYTGAEDSWYYLAGLDVARAENDSVVVFGDSIVDGNSSPVGGYRTFPDMLAQRLAGTDVARGVLNSGISGNRVLTDSQYKGDSAGSRFARDALDRPGVSTVILMEGINDIGMSEANSRFVQPNPQVSAEQLIAGYRELIDRAHDKGMTIIAGTLLPYQGAAYYSDRGEQVRDTVNDWIRDSGEFDGVCDFATALQSESNPDALAADLDSGDHLHPNSKGYQVMAETVELSLL